MVSQRRFAWACFGLAYWAACTAYVKGAGHDASGGGGGVGGLRIPFGTGPCNDAAGGALEAGPSEAGAAGESGGACVPLRQRSYATDVAPVLATCGGEICHGTFGSASGLLSQVIDVRATECCNHPVLVTPGHPEASYLLNKVRGEGLCAGVRMPPPGPLSAEQIQILSDWICEGAPTQ